jgi:hypothetical protein
MNRQKSLLVILGITTGFILMYCLFNLKLFLYISVATGITGLVSVPLSKYIAIAWEWIGEMIGNLVSTVILCLVFFLIIILSITYRLFKHKGPLDLPLGDTYYKTRDHEYIAGDMEELW